MKQTFIIRCDDAGRLPTDGPESGSDGHLEFFAKWREEVGLIGLPVTYGVVPKWVDDVAIDWLRRNLCGGEELAVHGIDHKRDSNVTSVDMADMTFFLSRSGRPVRSYIPPFNAYNEDTVRDWGLAPGGVFFGGFPGEHHWYNEEPKRVGGALHLSADRTLYGHVWEIAAALSVPPMATPWPRVVTLHVPWDPDHWPAIRQLIDRIVTLGELVSVDRAIEWTKNQNQ